MIARWTMCLPLLLAAAVPAQDRKVLEGSFLGFDEDNDGKMSRAEFPGSDRQFAAMDDDRDGTVTLEEYIASPVAQKLLAARYRNRNEPRARVTTSQLMHRRMEWLSRFDKNRDGKVTSSEWTGSPQAFATLDADGDGVIDARDRAAAKEQAPQAPPVPEFTRRLPEPEELIRRLDRDRDGQLSKKEAARDKVLAAAFAPTDRNRDGFLDLDELRRLVTYAARQVEARQEQQAKPRPFKVPFSAWDKNDDDRLEQNEWLQRRYLFPRIDQDRDAGVTREEVARYEKMIEGDNFVQRFDLNGDGKVTAAEFGGPPDAFRRADRNGDGIVNRSDR